MLLVHPLVQFITTILAGYVFATGIQRFRFVHLNHKTVFKWKRHAFLGGIVLVFWLVGSLGGLIVTQQFWNSTFITGLHGRMGVSMIPLIIFGLVSGYYMNTKKKQRRILPLLHGINNSALLLLALIQIFSGWHVYNAFVLGAG